LLVEESLVPQTATCLSCQPFNAYAQELTVEIEMFESCSYCVLDACLTNMYFAVAVAVAFVVPLAGSLLEVVELVICVFVALEGYTSYCLLKWSGKGSHLGNVCACSKSKTRPSD
jgi:hypothetical protein